MNRKQPTALLSVALVACGAGYFGPDMWNAGKSKDHEASLAPSRVPNQLTFPRGSPQLAALRVAVAAEVPMPLAEPLSGKIAYDEDVTARITSPVAGRITRLNVAAGDTVSAGSVLAILDAPDLALAVADARKTEADQARKQQALDRARKLFEAEVIPRRDLEAAEAELSQTMAESRRAQMRLRNLAPQGLTDPSGLALRAPIAGIVTERNATPALEVLSGAAKPLFVVSDLSRLWVLVDVAERHLSQVKVGASVSVQIDGQPGQAHQAVIARVGQVVNPETRRVQVRCNLANSTGTLKPEMFTKVTLLTNEGVKAVQLPNGALVTEGLYTFVFVEVTSRTFEKRKVDLAVQDREYSYVRTGAMPGERVVTGGALLLQSEMSSGP